MEYLIAKWIHVISSTLLFGTGVGSAFYLLMACITRDATFVSGVARLVVRADWLFTSTTAVLQPLTGIWMLTLSGYDPMAPWLKLSYLLYGVAIACWIPVVVIQYRMRNLAIRAKNEATELPPDFWAYFRWWVGLGFPALFSFLAIFWLMLAKPA